MIHAEKVALPNITVVLHLCNNVNESHPASMFLEIILYINRLVFAKCESKLAHKKRLSATVHITSGTGVEEPAMY